MITFKQNQINNLYSKFNFDSTNYAKNLSTKSPNADFGKKQDEFIKSNKTDKAKKIITALAIIGGVCLAVFSYKKFKLPKTTANKNPIQKLKILNFENTEKEISKLSNTDKENINKQLHCLSKKTQKIFSTTKKPTNFDNLERLIAIEKANVEINSCKIPDIIFTENLANENIVDIQKIFSNCFESNAKKFKYIKGEMSEFLTCLSEFSETTSKNSKKNIRTFFSIENFSEFIDDLEQFANSNEKQIFSDFIQNCSSKNKVSLIVNNNQQQKLRNYNTKGMILDFIETTKEEIKIRIAGIDIHNIYNAMQNPVEFKIKPENLKAAWLGSYVTYPKKENIVLSGLNRKINSMFLEELASKADLPLETFDLKESAIDELINYAKTFETKYRITSQERLLYIKNIQDFISKNPEETQEFLKLKEFLNTSYDKFGIQSAYDTDRIFDLPKSMLNPKCGLLEFRFKNAFMDYEKIRNEIEKIDSELLDKTSKLIKQKENLLREFFIPIEAKERGLDIEIPNGIMFYGKNQEELNELTEWIKTKNVTLTRTCKYNPNDPMASIIKMYDEAEKAEKLYQVTGKRTILHIENLDELLTDHDTIQKRSLIGRFKMFIEHASKKFHTTILMTTQKDLNDFEEASIGDHRFNIKARI